MVWALGIPTLTEEEERRSARTAAAKATMKRAQWNRVLTAAALKTKKVVVPPLHLLSRAAWLPNAQE